MFVRFCTIISIMLTYLGYGCETLAIRTAFTSIWIWLCKWMAFWIVGWLALLWSWICYAAQWIWYAICKIWEWLRFIWFRTLVVLSLAQVPLVESFNITEQSQLFDTTLISTFGP